MVLLDSSDFILKEILIYYFLFGDEASLLLVLRTAFLCQTKLFFMESKALFTPAVGLFSGNTNHFFCHSEEAFSYI